MTDPRILEKIQKCLAMANDGRGDPTEAATAMRMAQALMAKHGVEVGDIAASTCAHQSVKSAFSVSKLKVYENTLFHTVADAFGCSLLWAKSNSHYADVYARFTLIGRKQELEVAVYTAVVLQRQLVKARAEFVRKLPGYYSPSAKTKEADGFCIGWVRAVRAAVAAFADADGKLAAARLEYTKRHFPGSLEREKAKSQERVVGNYGLRSGAEVGAKVALHRPMQQGPGPLQLGS